MAKRFSLIVAAAAAAMTIGGVSSVRATTIYDFDEAPANFGGKTGPDGFVKNGSIVVAQTSKGATQGSPDALENLTAVGTASGGTNGAAYTFDIPAALVDPATTSANVDVTLSDALTYYNLEPRFEISAPDGTDDYLVGTDQDVITPTNLKPAGSTFSLNLSVFKDPDATTDQTTGGPGDGDTGLYDIGQILAQDSAFDNETYTAYLFQLSTIAGQSTDGATTVEADFDSIDTPTAAAVPEPASLAGLAIGGLLLARRRRQSF